MDSPQAWIVHAKDAPNMDRWLALTTLAATVALIVAHEIRGHVRRRRWIAADRRRTNEALRLLRRQGR